MGLSTNKLQNNNNNTQSCVYKKKVFYRTPVEHDNHCTSDKHKSSECKQFFASKNPAWTSSTSQIKFLKEKTNKSSMAHHMLAVRDSELTCRKVNCQKQFFLTNSQALRPLL